MAQHIPHNPNKSGYTCGSKKPSIEAAKLLTRGKKVILRHPLSSVY